MEELRKFWRSSTNDLGNFATQYSNVNRLGDASKYHAADCIDAIGSARNVAGNRIEGKCEQMIAAAGECTIHVKLTDDAPGDCSFSYLEVAFAAENMVAKCLDDDGAPGQTFLRCRHGKCTAGIKFCPNNDACF